MPGVRYKCVFLIVDGLGDLPVESLRGQTPLEAAYTPALDRLAAAGRYGLVDPAGKGAKPSTHSGAALLLGLEPAEIQWLMRGPVEAEGAGRELQAGEVALRANFAHLKPSHDGFVVLDRRAGRITHGVRELAAVLSQLDLGDGVCAEFRSTHQHRGVLVLSGEGLDAGVSDTDPGDENMPAPVMRCQPFSPVARKTAEKLNLYVKMANALLQDHPVNRTRSSAGKPLANGIITRGAGTRGVLHNVISQKGLSAAVVSGCNTVCGLGRMFGFEVITRAAFTGGVDTDLAGKIRAALDALQRNDISFVHFKAPDVCAHDRHPAAKREFLERMDTAMTTLFGQKILVALAADHSTDSNSGMHTAHPVPALLHFAYDRTERERVNFSERACQWGTMNRQSGSDFLQKVLAGMVGQLDT
jgi:2,3-bisphosphoglycerate-independent phosphoglycerate mutase